MYRVTVAEKKTENIFFNIKLSICITFELLVISFKKIDYL